MKKNIFLAPVFIALTLMSQITLADSSNLKLELKFSPGSVELSTAQKAMISAMANELSLCGLRLLTITGNGDVGLNSKSDIYYKQGIARTDSVRSEFVRNNFTGKVYYTEANRHASTQNKLDGIVSLSAVPRECDSQDISVQPKNIVSPKSCDVFLEPGVNKILLSDEQVAHILAQKDPTGVSTILRSYESCVDQAAVASGHADLDEVSELIIRQLSNEPGYTGNDLIKFVNYVVNMMLFSTKE